MQPTKLFLKPIGRDPRKILGDDGGHTWLATTCDPAFEATLESGTIPAGRFRVRALMRHLGEDGQLAGPKVYIPDGKGHYQEYRSVELLESAEGWVGEFTVVRPVSRLRFDPSIYPCEFAMDGVEVEQLDSPRWQIPLHFPGLHGRMPTARQCMQWMRSGISVLFREGPSAVWDGIYWTFFAERGEERGADYAEWVREYESIDAAGLAAMRAASRTFARQPLISIITPVFNTPEALLEEMLASVLAQAYPNWELCLANDASTAPHIRRTLDEWAARDPRIKVVHRERNGHISAASNSALALATGEFVTLLDHDDALPPTALYWVVEAINAHPEAALIYSDEDKIDLDGQRVQPYFKCDWNYDLFLSHNLITHLGVYRADIVREIGGFREGFEGAQDYDLALRFIERISHARIHHIPRILYHWRKVAGSTAMGAEQKSYAAGRARKAIEEHLLRTSSAATVGTIEDMAAQRVKYSLPDAPPKVSIIIPTRNAHELVQQCVGSIRRLSTYPNYEILLVDNGSDDPKSLAAFQSMADARHIVLLKDPTPFNFSRLNNRASRTANGEFLLFLNNDTEVITPDWMEEMVSHAQRPDIGAVGAKLWYPDDTIQHAGIVLVAGLAGHAHLRTPKGGHGYFGRASLTQSIAAVTGACLCVRHELFERAGGFDETFAVAFNDIDLCLRFMSMGYRNLYTPYAELYHHESATRGYEDTPEKKARFHDEADKLTSRWMGVLMNDPYYNPNLALVGEPFTLARPPRVPRFGAS